MLDTDGRVTNWNPGAQRIKGYLPDEIIGQHFSQFYTEEDRDSGEPQRALETAAREGRFEKEGWRVRKDGTRFWAHVVIDPDPRRRRTLIGFAKITRDITERREAQEKLEKTREALFQSQKMEAIGQLTGGVAHDFNNLLMAVLGSLELLRKRLPDDPHAGGAQRGASLTQRMLAFARRQELDAQPLDLAGLVRGMTDLLARSWAMVRSRCDFRCQPPVRADANQLEMALLNLAVNARDAMPDGGPSSSSAREEVSPPRRPGGGQLCLPFRCRYRRGHGRRNAGARHRAVLHHQGRRQGHRPRPVHGARPGRGADGCAGASWAKDHRGDLAAGDGGRGAGAQARAAEAGPAQAGPALVLAVDDDRLVLFNTAAMLETWGTAVEAAE